MRDPCRVFGLATLLIACPIQALPTVDRSGAELNGETGQRSTSELSGERSFPPEVSFARKLQGTQPFCLSDDLYTLIVNAGHAIPDNTTLLDFHDLATNFRINISVMGLSETAVTCIVLSIILALSLVILLAGQYLAEIAVVMACSLFAFFGFFILIHQSIRADNFGYDFYACVFPFMMALICSLVVDIIVLCLVRRVPAVTNFVFGAIAGAVLMLIMRQILIASDPTWVSTQHFNDLYWIFVGVVALLFGFLAVCLARSDGSKSLVVITVSCTLGGYGVALAITALVNLYTIEGMPDWSFLAIFIPATCVGLVFQFFLTGNHAAENRENTRRRVSRRRRQPPAAALQRAKIGTGNKEMNEDSRAEWMESRG